MIRTFIITKIFEKQWNAIGLEDENLRALEKTILENPEVGDIIPGTGGLRKMRYAITKGKSSGARILYVDFRFYECTYLIGAFVKKEKDNLSKDEINEIKKIIAVLEHELKAGVKK